MPQAYLDIPRSTAYLYCWASIVIIFVMKETVVTCCHEKALNSVRGNVSAMKLSNACNCLCMVCLLVSFNMAIAGGDLTHRSGQFVFVFV